MQIDFTYDHILLFIAKKKSKILSKPLFKNLSLVSDPRQQGKVKHKLLDILFLIITAVISGADTWETSSADTSAPYIS
ncbi:MAG: transposase family protein [Psychromonas sp.]|nr:transposase family protein [Psychromonas sp.]